VFGIAISVTSTVVLTRALMDHGWLDTPQGKVAIGWLVFEDLLTVGILVLIPAVATSTSDNIWAGTVIAVGKAVVFVALMMFIGARIMPAILGRVVNTRSRELFVLVALTVAVGTALASAEFFDVSLALGAFVAGVVVSESPFSHQISADLLPFREAFAVVFFVSVGMLVNPAYLLERWDQVLVLTLLIVGGKGVVSGLLGAVLPAPGRTALVLAAGRGQIGEFSFIIGQTGLAIGVLDTSQYSLILAGAIVSIPLNALVFRLVDPGERALQRWPRVWRALSHGALPLEDLAHTALSGHVVIVGCGRVGRHIAETLGRLQIPRLVVEADPARLTKLRELGVPVLYGDASSSEILDHASLDRARALVITLPDDASALAVAQRVRQDAPSLRMIARASTWDGARRLKSSGVDHVVRPELEGGIEIVRRTLLDIELPVDEVQRYVDLVRNEGLDESEHPSAARARVLDHLLSAARGLKVEWVEIEPESPLAGRTIGESRLRTRTNASIVGMASGTAVVVNPGPDELLRAGDRIAIIGQPDQIREAQKLLRNSGKP
jgi:CPA2 family monovalent cation:H+ antiporter-2